MQFTRPNRCDNSGPNCVEVAIDAQQNRIVRSSQRPEQQVTFDQEEWNTFIQSVQAGQQF
ncbi:DUF397 domain-containing protein [Micromonospora marina]|uniref:DUF397 domain-containing protein n=1 Tax=Micromonospora marina TaxID=307120 RepID=UPI003453ABEE